MDKQTYLEQFSTLTDEITQTWEPDLVALMRQWRGRNGGGYLDKAEACIELDRLVCPETESQLRETAAQQRLQWREANKDKGKGRPIKQVAEIDLDEYLSQRSQVSYDYVALVEGWSETLHLFAETITTNIKRASATHAKQRKLMGQFMGSLENALRVLALADAELERAKDAIAALSEYVVFSGQPMIDVRPALDLPGLELIVRRVRLSYDAQVANLEITDEQNLEDSIAAKARGEYKKTLEIAAGKYRKTKAGRAVWQDYRKWIEKYNALIADTVVGEDTTEVDAARDQAQGWLKKFYTLACERGKIETEVELFPRIT